jgi:hypothetical protein
MTKTKNAPQMLTYCGVEWTRVDDEPHGCSDTLASWPSGIVRMREDSLRRLDLQRKAEAEQAERARRKAEEAARRRAEYFAKAERIELCGLQWVRDAERPHILVDVDQPTPGDAGDRVASDGG